jgi:hypothetical protein
MADLSPNHGEVLAIAWLTACSDGPTFGGHISNGGLSMNRTRALIVSLAVGLAAIAGVFALGHTVSLGNHAHATTNRQVAQRTTQLNRYEASLRRALAQKPPALPPVPESASASASMRSAAPTRVVYHRPPPVVVIKHRAGGESEAEFEGAEADD